jgi:hypothetical protein
LDAKFALYLIKSPFFRRLISETQVGAIRDELFFSVFTDIEVPIPQLTRQREIVRYIETQLSAYSQVRLLRDQAEVTMRKLIYHLFGQSYTGDRTDTLDTADSYLQDDTENWEAIATTESLA